MMKPFELLTPDEAYGIYMAACGFLAMENGKLSDTEFDDVYCGLKKVHGFLLATGMMLDLPKSMIHRLKKQMEKK